MSSEGKRLKTEIEGKRFLGYGKKIIKD